MCGTKPQSNATRHRDAHDGAHCLCGARFVYLLLKTVQSSTRSRAAISSALTMRPPSLGRSLPSSLPRSAILRGALLSPLLALPAQPAWADAVEEIRKAASVVPGVRSERFIVPTGLSWKMARDPYGGRRRVPARKGQSAGR